MGKTKATVAEETPPAAPSMMVQLDQLAQAAAAAVANGDQVPPVAAGTFALYVTPERTLLLVTSVDDPDSPLGGERSMEIPAGMLRAAGALAGGAGKLGALKAMMGGS